jgi:hypothetical protein
VLGIDATWMVLGQVKVDDPTLDLMQEHPLDLTKDRVRETTLQGELAAAGWSKEVVRERPEPLDGYIDDLPKMDVASSRNF